MFGSKTLQIEKKKRIFRTIRYTIKIGYKPTVKERLLVSVHGNEHRPVEMSIVNTISP